MLGLALTAGAMPRLATGQEGSRPASQKPTDVRIRIISAIRP
jgi:hypothetical protein